MIAEETIEAVKDRAHARAEEVLLHLLPGGRRSGNKFVAGGVDGSRGESLDYILDGTNEGYWKDWATDEGGSIVHLWMKVRGANFPEAIKQLADFLGMSVDLAPRQPRRLSREDYEYRDPDPTPAAPTELVEPPRRKRPRSEDEDEPLDWQKCLQDFAAGNHAEGYVAWRGGSTAFAQRMNEEGMLGIFRGCFAWPVHDSEGSVIGCHYATRRPKPAPKYLFYPKGVEKSLLVVGDPKTAGHTLITESQGDAYAVLDSLGYHEEPDVYAAIITRGLSSDISSFDIPAVIAIPQNDPESKRNKKTQRTPAEQWLENIRENRHKNTRILVGKIPTEFKDANDWIRDAKPNLQAVRRRLVEIARSPMLQDSWDVGELVRHRFDMKDTGDPASLIGFERRWLGKGTSFIITGPGGIGKSTLIMSMAAHWAAGASWHGIKPRRALKVLIVQAENDKGDLAEMFEGAAPAIVKEMGISAQNALAVNLIFHRESGRTGEKFAIWLEEMITESGCDLVIIDPLLSYVGGDLAKQEVASQFFRQWMDPILHRTGVIMGFVHHTGKTSSDSKSRKDWVLTDFQYIGMGSSELSNWPRATAAILPVPGHTGKFRFMLTKRGNRAGMTSKFSAACVSEIFLGHGKETLSWDECEDPDKDTKEAKKAPKVASQNDPKSYLAHLPDDFTYPEAVTAFMQGCGMKERQAKLVIQILTQGGHITRDPKGRFTKGESQLFG